MTELSTISVSEFHVSELMFYLTVHHQLGKVIQMNQLNATTIYWSIRSAQHTSGNLLPIIRSVRLKFFTAYGILLLCTVHIVPRCRSPSPCPPQQQDTLCCKKISVSRSWWWAKDCPKQFKFLNILIKSMICQIQAASSRMWWAGDVAGTKERRGT